jgi:hypothetical protein
MKTWAPQRPRPLKCARQYVMLEFEHRLRD